MYSRSYSEKPIPNMGAKKEAPIPENYSGTVMRCDIPNPEEKETHLSCDDRCRSDSTECADTKKSGIFGDSDELLLLAMLFLFSGKDKDKSENDLLPLLAMLFISGIF